MRMDVYLFGDEVLRRRADEIPDVTPEVRQLAEDMLETMYYHDGLGLAAPQVGVSLRLAVIDVRQEGSGKLILINPVIRETGRVQTMEEGCLSFPDIAVPVDRAAELTVEFTTLSGKRKEKRVSGVAAQAVQHEIDHLDGILIVDRMNVARRTLLSGRLRRLRKRGEKGERR
jgi:peptide deformylase